MTNHILAAITTPNLPIAPALRWSRPDTTGWTEIQVGVGAATPTGGVTYTEVAEANVLFIPAGNYIVRQVGALNRRLRFRANGTVNLAWIGGEIDINHPWTDTTYDSSVSSYYHPRMACDFYGDFRTLYLEGIHLHGEWMVEGINISGGTIIDVTLQNCRIILDSPVVLASDVWDGYYHHDPFQSWAGLHSLRFSNVTLQTNFQGFMFGDGSLPTEGIRWRQMNLHRVNVRHSLTYGPPAGHPVRIINFVQQPAIQGPLTLDQVFVDPRPYDWALGSNGAFWAGSSVSDVQTGRVGWVQAQTYPLQGVFDTDGNTGAFLRGTPPHGDFCPIGVAGTDYQVPPNIISEPLVSIGDDNFAHDTARTLNISASESLGGATVTGRQWTVVSGPAHQGETLSTTTSLSTALTTLGDYHIRYDVQTNAGDAWDDVYIRVLAHQANWLRSGIDFANSLDDWTIATGTFTQAHSSSYEGSMQWSVTANGSVGSMSQHTQSYTLTKVIPGEQITAQINIRQTAGTAKGARVMISYLDSGRASLSYSSNVVNATLGDAWFTLTTTDTVPAEAAYARIYPYVQGAVSGDVFYLDNAYLGDVVINPNKLPGDTGFVASIGEWIAYVLTPTLAHSTTNGGILQVTANANGSLGIIHTYGSSLSRVPVTPGALFRASMSVMQANGTYKGARVQVVFQTSSGSTISTLGPASPQTLTGSYQTLSHTDTVPATAAWARLIVYVNAAQSGDVFRLDDAYLGDV